MNATKILLTTCTNTQKEENVLFVTDDTSKEVAEIMWTSSSEFPNRTLIRMADRKMHGDEPPPPVAAAMADADVIFGITKFSLFHTDARRNAVKNGARFANMADYSIDMFEKGGLFVDFIKQGKLCDRLSDVLEGRIAHVTTDKGTDITFSVAGRKAVRQYGRSLAPGSSSSPPDIETALGPLERTANGIVVIDGGIPHPEIGVLSSPITLTLENGKITTITGGDEATKLEAILKSMNDEAVYLIAEMGIGLNDKATLSNRMLEDEGVMGTMHFGFGSNTSFGGTIISNNHIDMIFKNPSLTIDGRELLANGELVFEK